MLLLVEAVAVKVVLQVLLAEHLLLESMLIVLKAVQVVPVAKTVLLAVPHHSQVFLYQAAMAVAALAAVEAVAAVAITIVVLLAELVGLLQVRVLPEQILAN